MKTTLHRQVIAGFAAAMMLIAGCTTPEGQPDRTATGALTGGALGAGTGAIIGSASGRAGAGALIGGAIGALTGGIIGNAMDQQQREILAQQSPQTLVRVERGQPLGLADIKALSKTGISDEVIISQIRNSRTMYRLSTAEILDLKDSGVSDRVINFMINTPAAWNPPPPPQPPPTAAPATVVNPQTPNSGPPVPSAPPSTSEPPEP
jgi:outer membrane lipoprotein SlyB